MIATAGFLAAYSFQGPELGRFQDISQLDCASSNREAEQHSFILLATAERKLNYLNLLS